MAIAKLQKQFYSTKDYDIHNNLCVLPGLFRLVGALMVDFTWEMNVSFLSTALARHASLVCCCLPCQCEEWSYYVCSIWYWDPKRNWNQQSSSSLKAPISNPGDGITDESISTSNIQNSESCSDNFFFPCRSLQKVFHSMRVALW